VCVDGVNTYDIRRALSPRVKDDKLRVVLSWNSGMGDLDLSTVFAVPTGKSGKYKACNVGAGDGNCGGTEYESDNSDGGDEGCESLSVATKADTVYQFFVRKYPGQAALPTLYNSGAQIDVYSSDSRWPTTLHVPGSDPKDPKNIDSWWLAFCLDTTNNAIVPINGMSTAQPAYTNCKGAAINLS